MCFVQNICCCWPVDTQYCSVSCVTDIVGEAACYDTNVVHGPLISWSVTRVTVAKQCIDDPCLIAIFQHNQG